MRLKNLVFLAALSVTLLGSGFLDAQSRRSSNVNPPVSSTGVTPGYCDVRNNRDYAEDEDKIEHSLRQRIELFNQDLNESGEQTGTGQCLYGIHFLNDMTIVLKAPLRLINSAHPLDDGIHNVGTYISGRKEDGTALPVTIDAREVTSTAGQCAFMIEDGLLAFQRIHDITILVSDARRAICDDQGNDIMNEDIPDNGSRGCDLGTKAKDCDFKDVQVEAENDGESDDDLDGDGVINDDDICADTPEGEAVNEVGCPDSDDDDIFDNVDNCPGQKGSFLLKGCPIRLVLKPIIPPRILCILRGDCGPIVTPGDDDGDDDGIKDDTDLCPEVAGAVINAGCPDTMCISFADGLPKQKENVDEDEDNIDKACDVDDTPRGNPPPPPNDEPPTCSLTATADSQNFDLAWETENAATVTLSNGTETLSSEVSGTEDNVSLTTVTTFTLTATGEGGVCSRAITLTPGSPVPTAPVCDLVSVTGTDGYDLTWTSTNGETAVLMESGNTTALSTELNSTAAVHVTPTEEKTYTLTITGASGSCSDAVTLEPLETNPTAPTCDLIAADADAGFNLTWTSANGTTAVLSDGIATLSTDLNSSAPLAVTPAASTVYSLTITGEGGSCSDSITLAPDTVLDRDGDGILDSADNCPDMNSTDLTDTNNDGEGNPCDVDDDGDGVNDDVDNCDLISNPDQNDDDDDDIGNACEGSQGGSPSPTDTDGDGIPNDLEDSFGTSPNNEDTDGDGLSDGEEIQSPLYPVCGPTDEDCDNDGVCDGDGTKMDEAGNIICQPVTAGKGDNCPLVSNGPNTEGLSADQIQLDSDGNGVGDACEGDTDGDEVLDDVDNCDLIPNNDQSDEDQNGFGDACDSGFDVSPATGGGCGCRIGGDQPAGDSGWALMGLMGVPLIVFRRMRKETVSK